MVAESISKQPKIAKDSHKCNIHRYFCFFFSSFNAWGRIIKMRLGADEYPERASAHYFLLDHLPLTLTRATVRQS